MNYDPEAPTRQDGVYGDLITHHIIGWSVDNVRMNNHYSLSLNYKKRLDVMPLVCHHDSWSFGRLASIWQQQLLHPESRTAVPPPVRIQSHNPHFDFDISEFLATWPHDNTQQCPSCPSTERPDREQVFSVCIVCVDISCATMYVESGEDSETFHNNGHAIHSQNC